MNEELQKLIDATRHIRPSPEEREAGRRSFVYGNTSFENDLITREMVDEEADRLAGSAKQKPVD